MVRSRVRVYPSFAVTELMSPQNILTAVKVRKCVQPCFLVIVVLYDIPLPPTMLHSLDAFHDFFEIIRVIFDHW